MASNENYAVSDYDRNVAFAQKLINDVMFLHNYLPLFINLENEALDVRYSDNIRHCIYRLHEILKEDIGRRYMRLIDDNAISLEGFLKFCYVMRWVLYYDGFRSIDFLEYCTKMCSIAVIFCKRGINDAYDYAINEIANVLSCEYFMEKCNDLEEIAGIYAHEYKREEMKRLFLSERAEK